MTCACARARRALHPCETREMQMRSSEGDTFSRTDGHVTGTRAQFAGGRRSRTRPGTRWKARGDRPAGRLLRAPALISPRSCASGPCDTDAQLGRGTERGAGAALLAGVLVNPTRGGLSPSCPKCWKNPFQRGAQGLSSCGRRRGHLAAWRVRAQQGPEGTPHAACTGAGAGWPEGTWC